MTLDRQTAPITQVYSHEFDQYTHIWAPHQLCYSWHSN